MWSINIHPYYVKEGLTNLYASTGTMYDTFHLGDELSNTKSAVCSPICDMFQTTFHGDVVLIRQNGRVDVVDILTGKTKHSISVTEEKIHHCSLSQSGQRLAVASERDVWICNIDHEVNVRMLAVVNAAH